MKGGKAVKALMLTAFLALSSLALAGKESPLERRLKSLLNACLKSLPGWSFVKGTYVFCPTPESLTKIYDGGYQAYTKRGAVAASSFILRREKPEGMVTMIVHYTKGQAQSKSLYSWLQEQAGAGKGAMCFLVERKAVACILPSPVGHVGYGYYGRIVVSVEAKGKYSEAAAIKALKGVLKGALPKRKGRR